MAEEPIDDSDIYKIISPRGAGASGLAAAKEQRQEGSWSFNRAGIAEFVTTFLFLYISILTAMGLKRSPSMCASVGIQGIAWAFGGVIFALVYCTAGISASNIIQWKKMNDAPPPKGYV